MDPSASQLSPTRALVMILFAAGLAIAGWTLLRESRGSGEIRGRVVESTGQGLAGARVEIDSLGWASITEADGSFELKDLPPGEYWLAIHAPWGAGMRLNVRVRWLWKTDIGELVIPAPADRGQATWLTLVAHCGHSLARAGTAYPHFAHVTGCAFPIGAPHARQLGAPTGLAVAQ